MQKLVAESTKAKDDAHRWLTETSNSVWLREGEALVLRLLLARMEKARIAAVLNLDCLFRKEQPLGPRVHLLCDELDSFKHCESTIFNLKATSCMVADAQDGVTDIVTGLQRINVSSYYSICCSVERALVDVSKRPIKMFYGSACSLQLDIYDAVCDAAEITQRSFGDAPGAADKRLEAIIGWSLV